MKRILICASAAIVALASCSETHVVYNEAPTEIGFKVVNSSLSKASALESLHSTMGVLANYSDDMSEYFPNASFVKHTDHWGGVKAHYYPMNRNLNFLYYAPYAEGWTADYSTTGSAKLISPALTGLDKTDLLYGNAMLTEVEKTDQPLPITLSHAMAKITINVKANTEDLITFNSVTLKSVSTGGVFTATYNIADKSLKSAEWNPSATEDKILTWNQALKDEVQIYGEPFFIVPSNYNTKNVEQTTLEIVYSVKDAENLQNHKVSLDLSADDAKAYWEMGKHYIYNLSASVYAIQFTPVVEDMIDDQKVDQNNNPEFSEVE